MEIDEQTSQVIIQIEKAKKTPQAVTASAATSRHHSQSLLSEHTA